MASSSHTHDEVPFVDEGIIEAMSVNFESSADFLDLECGINLLGILIADEEPGLGGVKATLMGIWKSIGQIRIIRVKMNTYCLTVGSEKLAKKLLEDSPWCVKGFCFSIRQWPRYHSWGSTGSTLSWQWKEVRQPARLSFGSGGPFNCRQQGVPAYED
ncbi:hypothetical protein RchiOBHm_Chr2g0163321 [Rosa chinensis]|uniref:DUF4283 domain-containing protein n=1 Tax=Rosa chinensis TaxID=74649 RepID=A0A2P6S3B2_ROSCH|nr:hypothetical protein RchiOBHm_Chr2g0163321 [Rosa chinensis]